ncbi:MAG: glycosyltransferase [Vicinamibacterales bacterium]
MLTHADAHVVGTAHLSDVAAELAARGARARILTFDVNPGTSLDEAERDRGAPRRAHIGRVVATGARFVASLVGARVKGRGSVDVIVCALPDSEWLPIRLAEWLPGVEVVRPRSNTHLDTPDAVSDAGRRRSWLDTALEWPSRAFFRRADGYVAATPAMARDVSARRPDVPVRHIPSMPAITACPAISADERQASRRTLGVDAGQQLVLCLDGLGPTGAVMDLLAAWEHVAVRDARLAIVGATGEPFGAEVLTVVADVARRSGGRVDWRAAAGDVRVHLAAADLLVQTSGVALDNGVALAMALGVPVVARDADDGCLVDGINARLYEHGHVFALASAIDEMLSHPDRARSLAEAARRTIEDGLWRSAIGQRWTDLLDDVVGRRGRRPSNAAAVRGPRP